MGEIITRLKKPASSGNDARTKDTLRRANGSMMTKIVATAIRYL